MTKKEPNLQPKTLDQLSLELVKLRLDLKANKLKDTSQIKKVKKQIVRLKVKL